VSLVAWSIYDDTGAPLTGVVPAFVEYCDRNGVARTPPTILELGGGMYGFIPTTEDAMTGTAYLVDNGATASPRRVSGAVALSTLPFAVWHLEDDTGSLWVGAAPTVGAYAGPAGPLFDPGVTTLRTYLFAFSPPALETFLGVTFRADSAVGAYPEHVQQSLVSTAPETPVTPPAPVASSAPGFEDMSDVLELLASGTYSVRRPAATTYVGGTRAPQAFTTFSMSACVQPLDGLKLELVPDGQRNAEKMACFTSTELRTVDSAEPDLVEVFGLWHQVESVQRWATLGNYYRAILVRPAS
jgi:hypothetical protein